MVSRLAAKVDELYLAIRLYSSVAACEPISGRCAIQ